MSVAPRSQITDQLPVKKQWPPKPILECRKRHVKLDVSAAKKRKNVTSKIAKKKELSNTVQDC